MCILLCTFRYVHVLIQKMAVNVDLGFILSLVDFFSLNGSDPLFQVRLCTCAYTFKHVNDGSLQGVYYSSCWYDNYIMCMSLNQTG